MLRLFVSRPVGIFCQNRQDQQAEGRRSAQEDLNAAAALPGTLGTFKSVNRA
jgi:hypothetical protein